MVFFLKVKVDAKTKTELDEWKKRKFKKKIGSKPEKDEEPEEGEAKETDEVCLDLSIATNSYIKRTYIT